MIKSKSKNFVLFFALLSRLLKFSRTIHNGKSKKFTWRHSWSEGEKKSQKMTQKPCLFLKLFIYICIYIYLKNSSPYIQNTSSMNLNRGTLGVQTSARRNFREFREFRLHSRKFILAKTQKSLIRESLSSRKKQNYWFAKVYFIFAKKMPKYCNGGTFCLWNEEKKSNIMFQI